MKNILTLCLLICSTLGYAQTKEDFANLNITPAQTRISFERRELILTNIATGKRKRVKESALARIKMEGDTTFTDVVLEAFLVDSVIVTMLAPKQDGKKTRMEFAGFKVLPLESIQSIEYSIRHVKRGNWAVFLLTVVGIEAVVFPLAIPPLMGNAEDAYSQPHFPFVIAGGVALFVAGRLVHKSMALKEYRLGTDWKYEIVSK